MAGKSIVTSRAIVDIVRTAVQSSYGVTGFSDPSFGHRLMRWAGMDRPGIRLTTAGGLHLDLFITVAFGVPVAEVARQVDSAVRYSLAHYIGAEVTGLAIHVDGLRYQPASIEPPESAPEAHQNATSAAGETASRKRKPK
jgi:uncharacterized alkaline shock family protein YloU